MSQDRIQSDVVPLTHELLGHMLGTRRSSVTVAAGLLQSWLITYNRAKSRLRSRSAGRCRCECYDLIASTPTIGEGIGLDLSLLAHQFWSS